MSQNSGFYAYGGFPLGFEVGQRTEAFRSDWPVRASASLYARDVRTLTHMRQRALINRKSLGISSLPSWMKGSSRSFIREDSEAIAFPDSSLIHALRDMVYGTPTGLLLLSARFSRDSAQSLSTGMSWPHTVYQASVDTEVPLQLADGRKIRPADSLWDFLTAFDPISLPSEDNQTLILRNLDLPVIQKRQAITGVVDNPHVTFTDVSYEKDAPCAVVWNNSRSLSDTVYLPPVITVSPIVSGLDLSCDSLWPMGEGPWRDPTHLPAYPVPVQSSLVYADAPTAWPQLTTTGLIPSITPADGVHHFLLVGTANTNGWELLSEGKSLAHAHLCELSNGWDDAGEMIRLPRRTRESDLVYSGRQQRLWLASILNRTLGASTPEAQERTLSAALCLSVIVPAWDGIAFTLPKGTTRVNALDYPDLLSDVILSLKSQEVIKTSPNTLRCIQDLSSYRHVHLISGSSTLHYNVDYRIKDGDGSVIELADPLLADSILDVSGQGRLPFRLDSQESPTVLYPEPSRLSTDAWHGPLLISRGPKVYTCDAIKATRLLQPGASISTLLGSGVTSHTPIPSWKTAINTNVPASLPPFDLDMGVFA